MKIVGMHFSTNTNNERVYTIHCISNFDSYYKNPDNGRNCIGEKAESFYVGNYDCSGLKIGMDIEIFYDRAIKTSKGTFQPIKRIEIIK